MPTLRFIVMGPIWLILLLLLACNAPPPSATPTIVAVSPSSMTTPTGRAGEAAGTITGSLRYPSDSDGVPAMLIYAVNTADSDIFYTTRTDNGDTTFTIPDVEPGDYYVVAYLADVPDTGLAGGYSQMVPCGLTVECTDHSLIPVTVAAGETVEEVQVHDWYAPEGAFPPRPDAPAAGDAATATSSDTPATDSLLAGYEDALIMAVTRRNYDMMQNLMGNPFTITGWRSSGTTWEPVNAAEQLRTRFYGPENDITFPEPQPNLDELLRRDPAAIWGETVNVVSILYSSGWGQQGNDDALLVIAQRPDGAYYWHGIVFATGGF